MTIDRAARLHPRAIALDRAHQRTPTCPARKPKGGECTCAYDPLDLADVWAGLARMATARRAAGAPLNRLDHEALQRQETP